MHDRLYEKTQETLSMLKLLAMTSKENPNAKGIKETFRDLRKELNAGYLAPSTKQ